MKKVIADHRESADLLIQTLKSQYNFQVEIRTLKYGDYYIKPDLFIERKTTKDFLVSIVDGRLFKQAFHLSKYTKRPNTFGDLLIREFADLKIIKKGKLCTSFLLRN
ncbi:MAG: hypothetical protein K9L78_04735 [Victivallales bacterium]|nr:hypothetical protein [Victivallales bacterium]MCF7889409.1 hypothetical protein [Victivallales bacterium]